MHDIADDLDAFWVVLFTFYFTDLYLTFNLPSFKAPIVGGSGDILEPIYTFEYNIVYVWDRIYFSAPKSPPWTQAPILNINFVFLGSF